jgi:hypothetical protein
MSTKTSSKQATNGSLSSNGFANGTPHSQFLEVGPPQPLPSPTNTT